VPQIIAIGTSLGLALSVSAFGQQDKESSLWEKARQELLKEDLYPTLIKVYSRDGKQSLTGSCKAKDPATGQLVFKPRDPSSVNEITCTLISVRFLTPDERRKETPMPSTDEEFIKYGLRDIPKFADELKKNPQIAAKKAREEWNRSIDKLLCSKESIAHLQMQIREVSPGPKMKEHYQTIIRACLAKDFNTLIDNVNTQDARTCGIWVETFTLEFKRIGKGKWLTGSEPQGLCNVVSIWEMEISGPIGFVVDTVKNTVVTVGGTKGGVPEFPPGACKAIREEAKEPTVWRAANENKFEPTCDFIRHDYIFTPFPGQ
jgi:hypothetical protein